MKWREKRSGPCDCGCGRIKQRGWDGMHGYGGAPRYAQGGYIPTPPEGRDTVPIMLSRGHTLMTYASYKALGPDMIKKLFPDSDVELILTADEARELGSAALAKLQKELDERGETPTAEV